MKDAKPGKTKKNVTLVAYEKDGVSSYKLIGPAGEIAAYTVFADILLGRPYNTRRTYCQHLANFYDYLFEACFHLVDRDPAKVALTKGELRRVIECWNDFLVVGESSGKDLVKLVCSTLPSPLCAQNTSASKHAALRLFLRLSEHMREEAAVLVSVGLLASKTEIDVAPLFDELDAVIPLRIRERQAMLQDSMLAGVIYAKGAALRAPQIVAVAQVPRYDASKAFPLEKAEAFIAALSTYRDKALYCLYAASGCRSNEGLQLLIEDIKISPTDPLQNRVLLIDPKRRWNHPSYRALSAKDKDKLAWKGRDNDVAFMIEPFASMFFDNIQQYLSHEYYPHNTHSFLFQILKSGASKGRPYFLTCPQTRQEVFHSAADEVGIPETADGPHSFRHAYGTYLLNYFPRGHGQFGLPMATVRVMMGHAKIASTEKYAVVDSDLINMQLSVANILLYRTGTVRSFMEQKLDVMRAHLLKFESTLPQLPLGKTNV